MVSHFGYAGTTDQLPVYRTNTFLAEAFSCPEHPPYTKSLMRFDSPDQCLSRLRKFAQLAEQQPALANRLTNHAFCDSLRASGLVSKTHRRVPYCFRQLSIARFPIHTRFRQ